MSFFGKLFGGSGEGPEKKPTPPLGRKPTRPNPWDVPTGDKPGDPPIKLPHEHPQIGKNICLGDAELIVRGYDTKTGFGGGGFMRCYPVFIKFKDEAKTEELRDKLDVDAMNVEPDGTLLIETIVGDPHHLGDDIVSLHENMKSHGIVIDMTELMLTITRDMKKYETQYGAGAGGTGKNIHRL